MSWTMYGNTPRGNEWRYPSAWIPARGLVPSTDPGQRPLYRAAERFDHPADRTAWPTPAATPGRTRRHYGPITIRPPAPQEISTIPS